MNRRVPTPTSLRPAVTRITVAFTASLVLAWSGPTAPALAQAGGDAAPATGRDAEAGVTSSGRSSALVDLEDEVMCIVCKRPLATSGGDAADEERSVIQGYLDQGLTKDQVKDRLVAEYGEKVLVTGSTPVTAAAPVIVAIVGAASVVLLLRGRRRRGGSGPGLSPPAGSSPDDGARTDAERGADADLDADDEARIDAELAERG